MMYCERCNAEFSEAMVYCKWCGQTLIERRTITVEVRKCHSCSTPLQEGWTFCNSCGAQSPSAGQEPASPMCLRCGAVISPGATICLQCGHRVSSERGAIQQANETAIIQYCLSCGDTMEAGKMYCKTCGAPIYDASLELNSPFMTIMDQSLSQQTPPVELSAGTKGNPPTPPAEPVKETIMVESPGAQANQSNAQTEVYQSFKPETAPTEHSSTIVLNQDKSTSPTDAKAMKKDSLLSAGKTIEYGAFNQLRNEAKSPSTADDEDEDKRATMQILSASDLQAEPDVFDPFKTPQEGVPDFPLEATVETLPAGKEVAYNFEITPIEEPADKSNRASLNEQANEVSADTNAIHNETASPLTQSETMYLEMDALPFESTIKENTGPLTGNRPTKKLSGLEALNPSAVEGKPWQPPTARADDIEASAAPQEPLKQLPQEQLTIESPRLYDRTPAKHSVNTGQDQQQVAPPWPQNHQGIAQQGAKKKSGVPVALIAAAVLVLAVAAAAVWWFVLRSPQGEVISPNANLTSSNNANLNNANTSTANTNTAATLAAPEGMVAVAAGEYTLGRDDGDDIEKPRHRVTLKAFFIDKTEVTNAEYKKFVEATNHQAPPHWQNKTFPEGQANFPVVRVNWQDANDYAKWAGKRLPTEAEWEAAARGATSRKYPWGNEWNQAFANIGAGESGNLMEVGKYPEGQSPFGALDMIGNAWEWTADLLALYEGNSSKPPDEANSNYRVIRGGAFNGNKIHDASYRGYIDANTNRKDLDKTGFRCAKDANQ